jgi:hypothetical protein
MERVGNLDEYLQQALPLVDGKLEADDVPVAQRPLHAAIEFVVHFVTAVKLGDRIQYESGEHEGMTQQPWFAMIYAEVREWYLTTYGVDAMRTHEKVLVGAVRIAGSVFLLHVPTTWSTPGEEAGTHWIAFPDDVRSDEDPLIWIRQGPNLAGLDLKARRAAEKDVRTVVASLRTIHSCLLGLGSRDTKMTGLVNGVLPRLEQAASLLSSPGPDRIQHSYWEMHLACELALKALSHQQTGTFKETHDLFALFDGLVDAPGLSRDWLKRLPRKDEVMELRYGQGTRTDRPAAVAAYLWALKVAAATVGAFQTRMNLRRARFLIRSAPPWTRLEEARAQAGVDLSVTSG